MAAINGIYLPGWEYNRLLGDSPHEPRNSALPGAIFWNGAAPLWMFEKVYCTKESLDNERLAAQEIGWSTSRIFGELARGIGGEGPILEPVDWNDLDENTKGHLDAVHDVHGGRQVRHWIDQANDPELERMNYAILNPVAISKQSVVAGSMSGLRHWLSPSAPGPGAHTVDRQEEVQRLLKLISDPISKAQSRNGLHLMRHPRDWDPVALARQDEAKERVETPYIRDLLAGEGAFAGERGYESYIRNVATERDAYRGVDAPLVADWERNQLSLLRLRDVASKHLWPKLHGDWLPALVKGDPGAVKEFPRYIKTALASRHFASILNLDTKHMFGLIGAALAAAKIRETSTQEIVEYFIIGSGAFNLFGDRHIAANVGPLAVFYQEAFRTLKG